MDLERLRAYMRGGIVIAFMAGLGYMLLGHTGIEEGQIKPETAWSWFTGVVTGTLIIYYFSENGEPAKTE